MRLQMGLEIIFINKMTKIDSQTAIQQVEGLAKVKDFNMEFPIPKILKFKNLSKIVMN